jgi:hypothetical protein
MKQLIALITEISHQLADIHFQLERIADHLEATEADG